MEIETGCFYIVSESFFERINDPFLKLNKTEDKDVQPHYFAFKDTKRGLIWLVPLSSKVEKYKRLLQKREEEKKATDAIQILRLFGRESVFLFQDMFPVTTKYLERPYTQQGQPAKIKDPKIVQKLEKTAQKIIHLLRKGVKFTKTQADVKNIEEIMFKALESETEEKAKN